MGKIIKKYIRITLINLIVFFVLLEITAAIYIKIKKPNLLGYDRIPTYLDFNVRDQYTPADPMAPHVIDTLYAWCTWHPKNQTHRQISDCFDVLLKYNEMGTRGLLPAPDNPNTIFFVGDSFVEGFGLEEDSTISERIGRRLNKQALNLGASGNFGTTQMSLIYKEFARRFLHKEVYVLLYLSNDFTDNNINYHDKDRYRPYRMLLDNDSSRIVYKGDWNASTLSWQTFNEAQKKGFAQFSRYSLKTFLAKDDESRLSKITRITYSRRFLGLLKRAMMKDVLLKPFEINYSDSDWEILETDVRSIFETASRQNAKASFINLPSKHLFQYLTKFPEKKEEYKRLEQKLRLLIEKNGGIYLSFYDFIMGKKINTEALFFSCDHHYSNFANALLSDFIIEHYPANNLYEE